MNMNMDQSDNLSNILNGNLVAASVLCTSTNPKDVFLMEKILETLHEYRSSFPESDQKISQTIFQIFNISRRAKSDFMRHRAQVTTFLGYANRPTKEMSVMKELTSQMIKLNNTKEMWAMFQLIVHRCLKNYDPKKDADLKVAVRLKKIISMMAHAVENQKSREHQRWLHNNSAYLANLQPIFKDFAKQFPKPKPKPTASVPVPLEPSQIYGNAYRMHKGLYFNV